MRFDVYLEKNKYYDSRTKAKLAIEKGEVLVNGKAINKPSYDIDDNILNEIRIINPQKFVSVGGYKLEKALIDFNFSVKDLIVADIGASTGGFTDCLLQNGAKKIYSVDLNDDLLHISLRNNSKVKPIIKNARDLSVNDFSDKLDLVVADLSFISITYVIKNFFNILGCGNDLIVLIKPQFETGEKKKFKNGIIKDKTVQKEAILKVLNCATKNGFNPIRITNAPIVDNKNVEFLVHFVKDEKNDDKNLKNFIDNIQNLLNKYC